MTALSRSVVLIPEMPGRVISISTTCGWKAGTFVMASSPVRQTPTHSQSGLLSTTRRKLVPSPGLSSTMATVVMGETLRLRRRWSGRKRILLAAGERQGKADAGAGVITFDATRAARVRHALPHAAQAFAVLAN